MSTLRKLKKQRMARCFRVRNKIARVNNLPHKAVVIKSNKHIYATLVEIETGKSLFGVSTLNVKESSISNNKDGAMVVGTEFAKLCLSKGISKLAFDRGSYLYHGKVAALANAMREAGIEF